MLKKRSLIQIFLGLFLVQVFLSTAQAAINRETLQVAEFVTAFLRGTCSKVEYDLRHDDSARAHAKRGLISLTRCVHEFLLVENHNDYKNVQTELWFFADAARMAYDFSAALYTVVKNRAKTAETISPTDQALVDQANELLLKNGNLKDLIKNADVISRTLLPELERVVAIALAVVDDNTKETKAVRFVASVLLSLTRLTQKYLNADVDSKMRVLWGLLLVISFSHLVYQLQGSSFFGGRTDFVEWLNQNFPAPAPQVFHMPAAPAPVAAPWAPAPAGPPVVPHNPAVHPNVVVQEQADGGVQIGVGGLNPNDQCGICLAGWRQQPVHIGVLSCRHVYHLGCLQDAMAHAHNHACPLCREHRDHIMDYELQPEAA